MEARLHLTPWEMSDALTHLRQQVEEERSALADLTPDLLLDERELRHGFIVQTIEEAEEDAERQRLDELCFGGRTCTLCGVAKLGDEFYLTGARGGRAALTSRCKACLKARLASHTSVYRARKRADGERDAPSRDVIFQRDKGICQLCHKPISDEPWDLDHRVPLSLGGVHTADNLQLAHRRCNMAKGGRNRVSADVARFYDRAAARGQLVLV